MADTISRRALILIPLLLFINMMVEAQTELVPLWKRAVGGRITSWQAEGPDGLIYLIAHDQALHAVDPRTGADLWLYRPGGRLTNFLAVSPDGTIYIQNEENHIFAVNPGGDARWKCSVDSPVKQMPVLTPEGTLIFLLDKGVMAALSRKGEILWTVKLGEIPTASPVIDYRGQIYVALNGGILCYNLEGERLWTHVMQGITRLATSREGLLYAITGEGRVGCFDSRGKSLWNSGTEPGPVITLALRESDVLIQTASGLVFRVNSQGADSFYQGPKPLAPGYLTSGGALCFFDRDNQLNLLDFEKGENRILFTSPAVPSLPLVTASGLILFGADDWRFYALKGEKPHDGWSQFRANSRRDGSLYAVISAQEKEEMYKDDTRWIFYNYLTDSDTPSDQLSLVEDFRSYGENRAQLDEDIPFWDLLLMKMTLNKDDSLYMPGDEGYKDNPVVRAEAYKLLGEWAVFPARNTIIAHMRQEKDPFVLASACFALGEIASDWDGRSTATIGRLLKQRSFLGEERFVRSAALALEKIMAYNGGAVAEECWEYYDIILNSPLVSSNLKKEILGE
jgi:outer membrane protein assembly factor BamB